MTLDAVILKALEGGKLVTVSDIVWRVELYVRHRLEKLRVRGIVCREGRGGTHREFPLKMLSPDLAAKALCEPCGSLASVRKATARRARAAP
jgi:hypothetical protein